MGKLKTNKNIIPSIEIKEYNINVFDTIKSDLSHNEYIKFDDTIDSFKYSYNHASMHTADIVIACDREGVMKIIKSRHGPCGILCTMNEVVPLISDMISNFKLRKVNSNMFKADLSMRIQKAINEVLEGEYHDQYIRNKSKGDGP